MRTLSTLSETCPEDPAVRRIGPHLALVDAAVPEPGPGQVLIRVVAAGVNRADVAQSRGRYVPPAGSPLTLGLACAGTIASVGPRVSRWHEGDAVCALVAGGACADLCLADDGEVMPLPLTDLDPAQDPRYHPGFSAVSDEDALQTRLTRGTAAFAAAAILVEASATTWLNLVRIGGLSPVPADNEGRVVLVHGGTGNVGSTAIQIARALGCRVLATAGSPERALVCVKLGAEAALDRADDLPAFVRAQTGRHGADIILSVSGAGSFADDVKSLANHGTLAVIGLLGGTRAEIDLDRMLSRNLSVHAETLRSQPGQVKAAVCDALETHVWPLVRRGLVRPVLAGVWPLEEAASAHEAVLHGASVGAHALLP
jgi:NADPH:quinone reductase-like Zn-dependent oxidoreductase